ncbi:MAG: hypothetical protein MJA30_16985, partial [Cytophagales bacterium]|nr:hypothetical protein [Cytophagales bacterium]
MELILKIHKTFLCLFLILSTSYFIGSVPTFGQKKKDKEELVILNVKIVDKNENPVSNALVTTGEGILQVLTNDEGECALETTANSVLIIEARGYESMTIDLGQAGMPETITLNEALIFGSDRDRVNLPTGLSATQRSLVGAVSSTTGEELTTYPEAVFQNTLQGRIMGLTVRNIASGLGNNTASL